MNRVHTDSGCDRQQDRSQNHDVRDVVDNHTAHQHDNVHQQQDHDFVVGHTEHSFGDRLRVAQQGHDPRKRICRRDDKQDIYIGLCTGDEYPSQVLDTQCLIGENTDQQTINDRDHRRFGRGADAGVDTAQNHNRGQQCPEALLEQRQKAFCADGLVVCHQLLAVLTLADAVDVAVDHQSNADQHARNDARDEQR